MMNSKEQRIGEYFVLIKQAFKHSADRKKLKLKVQASIRWKKACKKYPIQHVSENPSTVSNYFSNEKIIIYTVIFGPYDLPLEPIVAPDNCEYIIITDQPVRTDSKWKKYDVSKIIPGFESLSNAEKNRYCKMLPHKIFPDVGYTIYIDGNIKVVTDLTEFVNHDFSCGMQFHRHKARKCVYEEIDACKIMKKAPLKALDDYKSYLRDNGFPTDYGMVECNVIVRDNKSDVMKNVMEQWWREYMDNDVKRDQLSLPFVFWKNRVDINNLCELGNNVAENPAIRVVKHTT
ncbi:MAG TPA: DUF616 domain-containing protein [Petrimonas sp.]|nr:DUF616 domain-containing protein [Petrimonas sp.]